jgi:hypothetical protein
LCRYWRRDCQQTSRSLWVPQSFEIEHLGQHDHLYETPVTINHCAIIP